MTKVKIGRIIAGAFFIIFLAQGVLHANYVPGARLVIKNLYFSEAKRSGLKRIQPVGDKGFAIGSLAYLNMELENCKSCKSGKFYYLQLLVDMDIYYEDGTCVYSEKEVKAINTESTKELAKTNAWIEIETHYLKPGGYKTEIVVRDENSGKNAFAIGKFKVYAQE